MDQMKLGQFIPQNLSGLSIVMTVACCWGTSNFLMSYIPAYSILWIAMNWTGSFLYYAFCLNFSCAMTDTVLMNSGTLIVQMTLDFLVHMSSLTQTKTLGSGKEQKGRSNARNGIDFQKVAGYAFIFTGILLCVQL